MLKRISCLFLVALALLMPASALEPPEIAAKGAILAEDKTGEILFELNADERLYPASTTKLLTAVVALENGNVEDMVTVSKTAIAGLADRGSSVLLKEGEIMSFMDLMRYLLIASGNDGANALAEHVSGSQEAFVELMNQKAAELGCKNTHFSNPHGLHEEDHYTSARDLLIIARYAMQNELIREIVRTAQTKLEPTNMHPNPITITTTNHLISRWKNTNYYYDSAIGIKTGSTTPAGHCLIAAATQDDLTYFTVVLGAQNTEDDLGSFSQTIKLLDFGRKNFSIKTLASAKDPITEAPLRLAANRESLVLTPESDFTALMPDDFDKEQVEIKYTVQEDIAAPVTKGQELGSVTFSYEGKEYGTLKLVSSEDIERSQVLYIVDRITGFFSSTAFKILVGAVLALVMIFAVYVLINRRSRRKRRRRPKNRYRK